MKRALLLLLSACVLLACDEDKKKAELLQKVGVDAAPSTPPTGVNIVPPTMASSAAPMAAKPPKDCGTGDPVIDDPDLDAELRIKLKKPKDTSPGPISAKDLATVTSVNLTKKTATLTEIDPCVFPKMTALRFLYLGKGEYSDLKPIANLVKMEGLRVSISSVEDIKPLEKLTLLDQLDLGRTHVRDLSSLSNNVNITELSLDDTPVSDISVLAKLTKLEKLSLKNTQVTDVSALKDLKHMKTLNVAGCAINNIDLLSPLTARGLKISTK